MFLKLKKYKYSKNILIHVPEEPGVYIFFSKNDPLYVSKSVNLKSRIKSYKSERLLGKTSKMISLTRTFSYIVVSSEIEALLLEAKLVNILQTPFNIQLKDDKHPLYIRITNNKYPLVITARKINQKEESLAFFGPFPSSSSVKKTLFLIRTIFPYSQHLPGKRPCIYSQMGLCNPCPTYIENISNNKKKSFERKRYLHNISLIKSFLNGNISKIKVSLRKEMNKFAKLELFEEANKIKSKLIAIEYITTPKSKISQYIENPNFSEDLKREEIQNLRHILSAFIPLNNLSRIECFDVAHISGSFPTASMITFINGGPEKTLYRHFKIRQKRSNDDLSSLSEVAKRRKQHLSDWSRPDLIIVDGGKGQVNVFLKEFYGTNIPIIGISKKTETLVIPHLLTKNRSFTLIKLKGPSLNLITRIRDEAHRFARKLHHNLIRKELFQNT